MEIANQDIREALKKSGVKQWELADKCIITNTRLCEKLRHELSSDVKLKLFALIQEIVDEKVGKENDWHDIPVEQMTEKQLRQAVKDLSAELEQIRRKI